MIVYKKGNSHLQRAVYSLFLSIVVLFVAGCSGDQDAEGEGTDKLFVVRKSDLVIGTLLRGSANAKENHKISPEASYKNILTYIAEENSQVKEGDLIASFETQDLQDDIEKREIALEKALKNLELKYEERRILLSENVSDLRNAKDAVVSAEESFARYYKYDGKKEKSEMESSVRSKRDSLLKAEEAYRVKNSDISSTIYDDESAKEVALSSLEDLETKLSSAESSYKDAGFKLRIFKKYTYPNNLTTKKNKLDQSKLVYEKVKIRAESKVIQKDNEIQRLKNENDKSEEYIDRLKGYLPLMEIRAPVDGILVYGDVDRRYDKVTLTVGMDCRRRRVLATIPEMHNLIVKFELPEQFHYRVKEGARCIISPDSIPTLKLSGHVSEIAIVPLNQVHWDPSSPKIYQSVITLDEQHSKFVSGMNVQVNIIEENLHDVANVPVEAVFEEDGEYFVYIARLGEVRKRIVQLGQSTDQYVHIVDGLTEGEKVYLYSPYK